MLAFSFFGTRSMEHSFGALLLKICGVKDRVKHLQMPRFSKSLTVAREGVYSYAAQIAEHRIPSSSFLRTVYHSPLASDTTTTFGTT